VVTTPSARLALTVVCWTLALFAEVAGILLLVVEGRRTGRALRRWRQVEPEDEGLFAKQHQLDGLVDVLAGNPVDRGTAVALLVIGVVVGTVGNLLTL
jgi:hypothetical protein